MDINNRIKWPYKDLINFRPSPQIEWIIDFDHLTDVSPTDKIDDVGDQEDVKT